MTIKSVNLLRPQALVFGLALAIALGGFSIAIWINKLDQNEHDAVLDSSRKNDSAAMVIERSVVVRNDHIMHTACSNNWCVTDFVPPRTDDVLPQPIGRTIKPVAVDLPNPPVHDPATARVIVDQLMVWSAGFCKAQAEKQGMDFATCFKRVSDIAIARIEQEQAKKKH